MSDQILRSLELTNFRAFNHTEIPELGAVNLITGKNNSGKSSLLEAVWLFARGASPDAIRELLVARDEITARQSSNIRTPTMLSQLTEGNEQVLDSVKRLFHKYSKTSDLPPQISIGEIANEVSETADGHRSLSLGVGWYRLREQEEDSTARRLVKVAAEKRAQFEDAELYAVVSGNGTRNIFKLDRIFRRVASSAGIYEYPCNFVGTAGLEANEVSQLWNDIQLTDAEEAVLKAVRLIVPGVERISVRSEQVDQRKPVPIVRIKGGDEPTPLKSFGDGLNRVFGLSLALISSKNGLLLLDEVENGLHYSVFPALWSFIFEVAIAFNVQVFATTHSSDCVRGFEIAGRENAGSGQLIRLQERNGDIRSVSATGEELYVAVREKIEVRG